MSNILKNSSPLFRTFENKLQIILISFNKQSIIPYFQKHQTGLSSVLYNVIMTFGGRDFLTWRFSIFLLCQNLESVGLSEIALQ